MSTSAARLYEQDFVRWTEEQSRALRDAAGLGTNLPLDWENLAEEVESLGRSQRHELRSRIAVILEHLLKLERSPAADPRRGWMETIVRERAREFAQRRLEPVEHSMLLEDQKVTERNTDARIDQIIRVTNPRLFWD